MSIPLVKNLDLDSINTSIIAIKRLLQQAGVSEGGNTIINNNSNGGVPLGTWASFENDSAPNGEWLGAGAFDANTYPALAMMLGGNTVPYKFDHSRPSDYELLSTLEFTAQYDGEVIVWSTLNSSQQYFYHIYINDVVINTASCRWAWSIFGSVPFKYGDSVRITGTSITAYARYYKHPLFIKATPTPDDTRWS